MLTQLVAGLFMLSVLVVIHEFGHFIVARLCGVGVPIFSVGMGPRLFGIRWGETDYRVSAVPVGGYVQMSGADPFGADDPDSYVPPEKNFMLKPIWQRLAILFAGPGFNLALPFFVFTAVLMAGEPYADNAIGAVQAGSAAYEAGISEREWIAAINGVPAETWQDAQEQMALVDGSSVTLTIGSSAGQRDVALPVVGDSLPSLSALGLGWSSLSSRIGVADPASPAGQAGLLTGDGITEVDGQPIKTWSELQLALTPGVAHTVHYLRAEASEDGTAEIIDGEVTLAGDTGWTADFDDYWVGTWGFEPISLYARGFTEESRAEEAGVVLGDRFYGIDGERVREWGDLTRMVNATAPEPTDDTPGGCGEEEPVDAERALTLTVIRDGVLLDLTFTPAMRREALGPTVYYRPLIGVELDPNTMVAGAFVIKSYPFSEALPRSGSQVKQVFTGSLTAIGGLLTGERRVSETFGGPVAIFAMAGESVQYGWTAFAKLLGAISLSLGIVNLLPVPALDGGQILFYTIEGIRGRPLSLRLRERIQMVGVLMLVALVLVVTFNDITRVITGG
ncbi:MAG: membrane-associated protease RseP (regulator of RpoE activity) [Myxococcota bacterium]